MSSKRNPVNGSRLAAAVMVCLGLVCQSSLAEQPQELFAAMEAGRVEARFIAHGSTQAVVQLQNASPQRLWLRLPATFGAVHVLAQPAAGLGVGPAGGFPLGGGGAGPGGLAPGGLGFGAGQGLGSGQGLGGGFGGGVGLGGAALNGVGLGGGAVAGGLFRLEPGATRKLTVRTVCLEHGKPEPNPRMQYALVPLESLVGDPQVQHVCQKLGAGEISPAVAQAAAWHLANGLSWDKLRAKLRHHSKYTGDVRWFEESELAAAWELVGDLASPGEAVKL